MRTSQSPRILIDAFWWESGPPSGKNIVRALVRGWAEAYPSDDLHVTVAGDVDATELPSSISVHRVRARPHALAAAVSSGLVARAIRADAVYTQNFAVPAGPPRAVFVHDAIFRTHPEWFTRPERAYFAPMRPLAHRATRVLTSTSSEARRIEAEFGVRDVRAVGLGVDAADDDVIAVRPTGVGDDERFVLSVGRLNVRKNLERLLLAAVQSELIRAEFPLLVVGEPDGRASELPESVRREIDAGAIRFLGFVAAGELRWLYERTVALAFPSLDEGFGLPPLEAAAHGCRSVVSDIPVFHETLRSLSPIFVDPLDVEDIRRGLNQAIVEGTPNPPARPYTWAEMVRRTRDEILELVP